MTCFLEVEGEDAVIFDLLERNVGLDFLIYLAGKFASLFKKVGSAASGRFFCRGYGQQVSIIWRFNDR